jgi:hypothetical protein
MVARFTAAATRDGGRANPEGSGDNAARLDARSESSNPARHAAPGGRACEHGEVGIMDVRPPLAARSAGTRLGLSALTSAGLSRVNVKRRYFRSVGAGPELGETAANWLVVGPRLT